MGPKQWSSKHVRNSVESKEAALPFKTLITWSNFYDLHTQTLWIESETLMGTLLGCKLAQPSCPMTLVEQAVELFLLVEGYFEVTLSTADPHRLATKKQP